MSDRSAASPAGVQPSEFVSARAGALREEGAFTALELAQAEAERRRECGDPDEVIGMHIGQPDFPTEARVIAAIVQSLQRGETRYCASAGISELRQEAAREFHGTRGLACSEEHILVGAGAKDVIFATIGTIVAPGDRVVIFRPYYPQYVEAVEFLGGVCDILDIRDTETGYSIDLDELDAHLAGARMVILNFPQNPTGWVPSEDEIDGIVAVLLKHPHVFVLLDEVYCRFVYDGLRHVSIAKCELLHHRVAVIDGLSKAYASPGSRLGYGWMPREVVRAAARVINTIHSCTPPFVQIGGVEALSGPQDRVTAMVQEFQRRRDLVVEALRAMGLRCHPPQGAFYVLFRVSELTDDVERLVSNILRNAGVSVISGASFGIEGCIRISYAADYEKLRIAMERLARLVGELCSKK